MIQGDVQGSIFTLFLLSKTDCTVFMGEDSPFHCCFEDIKIDRHWNYDLNSYLLSLNWKQVSKLKWSIMWEFFFHLFQGKKIPKICNKGNGEHVHRRAEVFSEFADGKFGKSASV